jgi:hypothetical protein
VSGAPFVTGLRTPAEPLVVPAPPGAPTWTLRVQAAEAWDAVKVVCAPEAPVAAVKAAAMAALYPTDQVPAEVVVKLRGAEVGDEAQGVRTAGALDGSTLFLALRRRRPVR